MFSLTLVVTSITCIPVLPAMGQALSGAGLTPAGDARRVSELNVSIAVFDPGVPDDDTSYGLLEVFPKIREVEAFLLPFMLRETLVETDEWGAVRVVPEPDIAAELLVSGEIVRSDGDALELQFRVVDAGGREWLNKAYVSVATMSGLQNDAEVDSTEYQELFDSIAEDIRVARSRHDEKALSDIIEVSFLRYAAQLAPSVFGGYLYSAPDGTFSIQRLPAEDDPMLGRIQRIRQAEYLFIDTVDEKFQDLHAEIESIYDLWLDYRRQVAEYEQAEVQRVQNGGSGAPRGSYEAIKSLYDNYKWARMQEQRQDSRAEAFDNEVGPTVVEMETRVAELQGSLDQQYAEWRSILAEIFLLETGLAE